MEQEGGRQTLAQYLCRGNGGHAHPCTRGTQSCVLIIRLVASFVDKGLPPFPWAEIISEQQQQLLLFAKALCSDGTAFVKLMDMMSSL